MSIKDYKGGIITKNPTTPTGPYQNGVASGVWTMDEAAEYTKQGVWPIAGNVNPEQYVEGLFSTYLYEGNGTSQTITNNLDLDGKGGMVWIKSRPDTYGHRLIDTERGVSKVLESYDTTAEVTQTGSLTAFNSNGFDVGNAGHTNFSGNDFVSWSFLKKPGFFDVVTYTGTGSATTISHNLGTVPGVMIIKRTSDVESWQVYHRDFATDEYIQLNGTAASTTVNGTLRWNNTRPTSSVFSIGTHNSVNGSGDTYVAYLFAHDAQLFGDNQDESIIKCGSYTGNGSTDGPEINLGWEPQFILLKSSSSGGTGKNWQIYDSMRGFPTGYSDSYLLPNLANAEGLFEAGEFLSTGFKIRGTDTSINGSGVEYIYIAIRRPMMTPTVGTEVFAVAQRDTAAPVFEGGFPVDAAIVADVSGAWANSPSMGSRLTGTGRLATSNTNAEASDPLNYWDYMDGWGDASGSYPDYYSWMFKRAPGFMDVVAYTGDGTTNARPHNLGVVPELMICKWRTNNTGEYWYVYHASLGVNKCIFLQLSDAESGFTITNSTAPTSSEFTLSGGGRNTSGATYIAYLFATLAGISKVGSYTGTAANLDVDCGFTAGARFILIKRTDSTGDWYVYDSVRGITSGNDPYLFINSSSAQVTGTDYIDPLSSGFTVTSSAPAGLNASGGTYIFLAIA